MLESQPTQAPPVASANAAGEPVGKRADRGLDSWSDGELAQASKRGKREAFEELVRRTSLLVYSHLLLELNDSHKAEDLTQETYLNAWRAIEQMSDPSGFRAWLLTIARSVLVDHHRRNSRKKRAGKHTGPEILDTLAGAAPEPSEQIELTEARERALQVLRAMPEDYRRPLMLRYLGGADYEDIGRQMGITVGALRGLLSRGMALLRNEMGKGGS